MSNQVLLDLLRSITTDELFDEASRLEASGAVIELHENNDKSLWWAKMMGVSGKLFEITVDLLANPTRPTFNCSCGSRRDPCAHALSLAIAAAHERPATVQSPPKNLLNARSALQKKLSRAQARAAKPVDESKQRAREAKAEAVRRLAARKLVAVQLEALVGLEQLMLDLVTLGLGALDSRAIEQLSVHARKMNDASLRGVFGAMQQLVAALRWRRIKDAMPPTEPGFLLAMSLDSEALEAQRQQIICASFTRMWTMVQRGKKWLEQKLSSGEEPSERDAALETLLGRAWKLPELKALGYWRENRTFVELCHEKIDDNVLQMESTRGYMLDVESGEVCVERTAVPYMALRHARGSLRQSRVGVVAVQELAAYPSAFGNRRVRWDEKTCLVRETPLTDSQIEKVRTHSQSIAECVKEFRLQLRDPLSDSERVVLINATRFGQTIDHSVMLEDVAGTRLQLRDGPRASCSTMREFAHAAGATEAGPTVVRLWTDRTTHVIFAQPLAVFSSNTHIRLGQ
jgi:hypothetical protein